MGEDREAWGWAVGKIARDVASRRLSLRPAVLRSLTCIAIIMGAAALVAPLRADTAGPSLSSRAADPDRHALFVVANTEFTLLHEFAHIIFHELNVPVLGREEDAADQFAMMLMLKDDEGALDSRTVAEVQAIAEGWRMEWILAHEDKVDIPYWDAHPLEIQRFYNTLCIAYGRDPERLQYLIENEILPAGRAETCEDEYAQVRKATEWVLTTHVRRAGRRGWPVQGNVAVILEQSTSLHGEQLMRWIRERSDVMQRAEEFSKEFLLPRDIKIIFGKCPFPNATWFDDTGEILFCYELMERFLRVSEIIESRRNGGIAWAAPDAVGRLEPAAAAMLN